MNRKRFPQLAAIAALFFPLVVCAANGEQALDVGDFVAQAEELNDRHVTVRGFVVGVCLSRGCKLFLRDLREESPSTLRVERTDAISPFAAHINGDTLTVAGIARTTRIDQAYLDNWETEVRGAERVGTPEELGGCGENAGGCDGDAEAKAAREQTLAQIADYRERIAANERGYLLSVWIDCTGFDVES